MWEYVLTLAAPAVYGEVILGFVDIAEQFKINLNVVALWGSRPLSWTRWFQMCLGLICCLCSVCVTRTFKSCVQCSSAPLSLLSQPVWSQGSGHQCHRWQNKRLFYPISVLAQVGHLIFEEQTLELYLLSFAFYLFLIFCSPLEETWCCLPSPESRDAFPRSTESAAQWHDALWPAECVREF